MILAVYSLYAQCNNVTDAEFVPNSEFYGSGPIIRRCYMEAFIGPINA